MITIERFVFNPFQVNTYLLINSQQECLIIDPACYFPEEFEEFYEYIRSKKLIPQKIVNTHCHIDHILGCKKIAEKYNIEFEAHEADEFLVKNMETYASVFNFDVEGGLVVNNYLKAGVAINLGEEEIQCIHVPGHSPGSICFHIESSKILVTGDVLFKGSVGRSDLPGGNHATLIEGIQKKLFSLPHNTVVYPGHGDDTTVVWEMNNNPFFKSKF